MYDWGALSIKWMLNFNNFLVLDWENNIQRSHNLCRKFDTTSIPTTIVGRDIPTKLVVMVYFDQSSRIYIRYMIGKLCFIYFDFQKLSGNNGNDRFSVRHFHFLGSDFAVIPPGDNSNLTSIEIFQKIVDIELQTPAKITFYTSIQHVKRSWGWSCAKLKFSRGWFWGWGWFWGLAWGWGWG